MSPDVELSLLHCPSQVRAAFAALWALDSAMGDVVAKTTEPALGAIKLAWWRERLEAMDGERPPAEPRLQQVATDLLPRGISGAQLAGLEAGWAALLQPKIDVEAVASRGALLFAIGGGLLGDDGEPALSDAGALYALASVGRRGVPQLLEDAERRLPGLQSHRFRRNLRPLTMLARAAARDVSRNESPEPEGSAARVAAMLAHRWSGLVSK